MRRAKFLTAPKMVSFFTADKNTPFLVQLEQFSALPNYFVTALAHLNIFVQPLKKLTYYLVKVFIINQF